MIVRNVNFCGRLNLNQSLVKNSYFSLSNDPVPEKNDQKQK